MKFKSIVFRAARTFLQTFLAVLLGAPLMDANVSSLKAAGFAGIGAVLSMIQRLLDDTPLSPIPPG